MKYKDKYRIESNRIPEYDYSKPGLYFITVCTKNRISFFGEIINNKMVLNQFGEIVKLCWADLPNHYSNMNIDEYIIMPDHIHGIIKIISNDIDKININKETGHRPVSTNIVKSSGLSEFIRALKSFSSKQINLLRNSKNPEIWQKGFYDHIIRNEIELQEIRTYIIENPIYWGKEN